MREVWGVFVGSLVFWVRHWGRLNDWIYVDDYYGIGEVDEVDEFLR